MKRSLIKFALLPALVVVSSAFQFQLPTTVVRGVDRGVSSSPSSHRSVRDRVVLQSTKDDKKKTKGPFDEGLRTKLVSESIAPWRTLRLFLYGSLGSGAAVGGFITLAGVAAALSGARTDVDLNTEVCRKIILVSS